METSLERAVIALTLSNLGTPAVIPVLKPYIDGERDKNTIVRITALNALSARKLPSESKSQVFTLNVF